MDVSRRRRKREAETGDTSRQDVYFNASYVVVHPYAPAVTGSCPTESGTMEKNTDDQVCFQSMAFILPLVVMALLMLVSMATSFYFCTQLISSKRQSKDGELTNPAFK